MVDRAFESDVKRFNKNIYQTEKGQIREAVLSADLSFLWQSQPENGAEALTCIDVGGGLGQINSQFAKAGYQVTHTDIAAEMVVGAEEEHSKQGISQHYRYLQSSLQKLDDVIGNEQFDVVLCHAVLEWLADPYAALTPLIERVKPGGWLSLMFYNLDAKLMANMIYGNFDYVNAGLQVKKKVRFSPNYPLKPENVIARLGQFPVTLVTHSGVRCFHDYMRKPDYNAEQLLALELQYRNQNPYRQLGRYQHLLLKKDRT
ncbi:methyltransferase family protein [Idiomarina sp. A28L]|uniref:methyltransferase domain-containing protein n=1 Tax=Idiomarina sp. A28L TaxID=1036674 RepID=UPI0002138929|nr:methyltransferase domain-containing protein [Idiomarina sp. A28L]EGN74954.1 methyltransferase family protein [Idiomarina sp. A28L]